MANLVYPFGHGTPDCGLRADQLGGKGAGLAEMARIGLPVPPGFTIISDVCKHISTHGGDWPEALEGQIAAELEQLGAQVHRAFGDPDRPLLVSVRSGAAVSMPGMMDTVLNLGLSRCSVAGLARTSGDERFAYDSYRRFLIQYCDVVLDLDPDFFADATENYRDERGLGRDVPLAAPDLAELCARFETLIEEETGEPFPQEPERQLREAINAVFRSWNSTRAFTYRKLHNIADDLGTAVIIQAMVFGNMGGASASGVAFTRDPVTGEKRLFGEYLAHAQGEDVVSGAVTPHPVLHGTHVVVPKGAVPLAAFHAGAAADLDRCVAILEHHYRDIQDIEFTIEQGKLFLLQTRSAKRSVQAAIRIAVDLVDEAVIDRAEAIRRIDPMGIEQLLHPTVDPDAGREILATGLAASPGAAVGELVFTSEDAEALKARQRPAILVRVETSPEDIHGMHAADGVVTTRGGMTSHAAVVARGMGKPCVTGAGSLRVDVKAGTLAVPGHLLKRGDVVTVDGTSGQIMLGAVALREPQLSGHFARLMQWADDLRQLGVRANAESPQDARIARSFGADGIGLCRTEQMLVARQHILAIQRLILAETPAERREAVMALLPMQRRELETLFLEMHGLPVTVRLFDPPLHEFLPRGEKEIRDVALAFNLVPEQVMARVAEYQEYNPTLGHRGVRLAISYPEIAEMQARAIFQATVAAGATTGAQVRPEIMVPLVAIPGEFDFVKGIVDKVAAEVMAQSGATIAYQVGAIVELPRAALMAGQIARNADFLSFGTNDLTQTTYGISRDDSVSFLIEYQKKGIIRSDPFVTLDQEGVGELVRLAIDRARAENGSIVTAMSGEHGGDPETIRFCQSLGLGYVSCSPFRVPIARLAAAQAAVGR